jgi:hypothetical protein
VLTLLTVKVTISKIAVRLVSAPVSIVTIVCELLLRKTSSKQAPTFGDSIQDFLSGTRCRSTLVLEWHLRETKVCRRSYAQSARIKPPR